MVALLLKWAIHWKMSSNLVLLFLGCAGPTPAVWGWGVIAPSASMTTGTTVVFSPHVEVCPTLTSESKLGTDVPLNCVGYLVMMFHVRFYLLASYPLLSCAGVPQRPRYTTFTVDLIWCAQRLFLRRHEVRLRAAF